MVDFAISAQFGLIYSKKPLALKPIFSHSFGRRAFKLKHKLFNGTFIPACAFDDDRTIGVAMVDFAISAQFGVIYRKKPLAIKPIFSQSFSRRAFKHLTKASLWYLNTGLCS